MNEVEEKIEHIAAKLPVLDIVAKKQSLITGTELLLCGHKKWDGEVIQPNKMYNIWVPIAKAEKVEIDGQEVVRFKELNHVAKLKSQWRVNGLPGIYHYLQNYLNAEQLKLVKSMFMGVSKTSHA